MHKNLSRAGSLLALVAVASCADIAPPVAPMMSVSAPARSTSAESSGEVALVNPYLEQLNAELEASGSDMRVIKAELLMDGNGWDGVSSTLVIADDRYRGIGAEWVPGDPRRGGRIGVNYRVTQNLQPVTRDADGTNTRLVPYAQLDTQIEEGMSAWRNESCSAPITRVPFAAGADITHFGWYPTSVFRSLVGGPSGDNIIGVTLSSIYINNLVDRIPTDIDRNGKADLARSQILYNARFRWGSNGAPNVVDFYSIITHETGHALGLGHFGKVFVTRQALSDGSISISDLKYAPYAIMNAVYVTGRNELAGTDHSSFCQIWAGVK